MVRNNGRFTGVCHGTVGEIIQGPFHMHRNISISVISLHARKYSRVHFMNSGCDNIEHVAKKKPRCMKAIDLYGALHKTDRPKGEWSFYSELATGKGMSSSTADIVSTIRCLDKINGRVTDEQSVSKILKGIERSDSVFMNSYALYLSDRQQTVRTFRSRPQLHCYYIDEGGRIETESTYELLLMHYRKKLHQYNLNLDSTIKAFDKRDYKKLTECATQSAILSQDVLPKRNLDSFLNYKEHFKADGVFVAHTGTLIGYLYARNPLETMVADVAAFARSLGHQIQYTQAGF